jgi:hypothetical protein
MKVLQPLALFALGALLASSVSRADTDVYSYEGTAVGSGISFDLGRFDPAKGTLDSVTFSYHFVTSGDVTYAFDNDSTTSGVVGRVTTATTISSFNIVDSDVKSALSAFSVGLIGDHYKNYSSIALDINDGDAHTGTPDSGGSDYAELVFLKGYALQSFDTTLNSSLSSFYVNGTDKTFTIDTNAAFSAYSGFLPTVLADYSGSLDSVKLLAAVTYNYTPVPEPSTYALFLGVATLGLVGWRRFRRK